jgi:hypothetical protein
MVQTPYTRSLERVRLHSRNLMAHFAQIDENNIVQQVIVVNNDTLGNLEFPESEPVGIEFCQSLFGAETLWAQTSYNASFRHNYAGIGFFFDKAISPDGAFIPPQPFASWTLNTETYQWESPVPYPDDGKLYVWDESAKLWVEPAL